MRTLLVNALALGLFAAAPVVAPAQTPPRLAPTVLLSEALGPAAIPGHTFEIDGTCDVPNDSTYTFEASGAAGGVYVGAFTEQGTVTVGGPHPSVVKSFQSTFEIHSGPYTITGTKRLTPESSQLGANSTECVGDEFIYFTARIEYEATIQGPNGTDHQEGIARVTASAARVGSQIIPEGQGVFNEVFVTSTPSDTGPGPPASLTLEPRTSTNEVGEEHCVTATVTDAQGRPVPGVDVVFGVSGSNPRAPATRTTEENGEATFCYTGTFPGQDAIRAFADSDGSGSEDAGEPSGEATKTWVLPQSTEGCQVTDGGHITAASGDKANTGGNAQVKNGSAEGNQAYEDHGPATPLKLKSIEILTVTCSADRTRASIFGTAKVNGQGSFDFRVDVTDNGGPGRNDTYRIRVGNGYDSGEQRMEGGNIEIH